MSLPALSHHNLLLLWTQLFVLVAAARGAGLIAQRLRQPPVVGEIAAGVLLGPSLLGRAWPAGSAWMAPTDALSAAPLTALAWVGAAMLLLLTGLETDLRVVKRFRRAVLFVTVGGLCLPAATGLLITPLLPAGFAGPAARPGLLAMFLAIALSISSLPVIARILRELGYLRRDFAQVTLGVGMLNDLLGWLALGFLATLTSTGQLPAGGIALRVGAVAALIVVAFLVGPAVVDAVLPRVHRRDRSAAAATAVVLTFTFGLASGTQAVGSEAVLGAYVAGVVVSRSRCQDARVRAHLETVTFGVFAPLFFATAGLRMDLGLLLHPDALAGTALVVAAAVGSKMAGAYASARGARLAKGESIAVAIGLNARGAVEIVIATVGLSLGVLSQSAYTAIALMAVLTSVISPPLLTATVRRWCGSAQEESRLAQEESLRRNLLVRPGRLLVPLLSPTSCLSVADVLHRAWPREAEVTVVLDGRRGIRAALTPHDVAPERASLERVFDGREISFRWGAVGGAPQAVLEESELGYSAVGIALHPPPASDAGNGHANGRQALIPPVAMTLLSRGRLPLVAVRCTVQHQCPQFAKLVVPVAGTSASWAALELALGLAETTGAEVVLLHVVDADGDAMREASIPVLDLAVETARSKRVRVQVAVRSGLAVAEEILGVARESSADLVVLGAGLRRTGDGLSFSHAVEEVLLRAAATVAVVVPPSAVRPEP